MIDIYNLEEGLRNPASEHRPGCFWAFRNDYFFDARKEEKQNNFRR
jgi:hypothetical protein